MNIDNLYKEHWGLDKDILELANQIEDQIRIKFKEYDSLREYNQVKVLAAFQKVGISERSFISTTGYGHNDLSREAVEKVFAAVFRTESAMVRPHISSGTQALNTALFAILRPGDELLAITGEPYDTLKTTLYGDDSIKLAGKNIGSLADFGINYNFVNLTKEGKINIPEIFSKISEKTKVIYIQRSRGYAARKSLLIAEIEEAINKIKTNYPDLIFMVDNCYGTFVETKEPSEVGADLVVGSLIKNAGGGLASTGAYIVGKKELVELCGHRLYAPGLGLDVGPMLNLGKQFLQGFYQAPHIVVESLKGLTFCSALLEKIGLKTEPYWADKRGDIVQTIYCGSKESLVAFCQSIQSSSAIDSHLTVIPDYMPGYDTDVVMAAGAFVQGSSIELSADGPLREPYLAFMQGGLVYEQVKLASMLAYQKIKNNQKQ